MILDKAQVGLLYNCTGAGNVANTVHLSCKLGKLTVTGKWNIRSPQPMDYWQGKSEPQDNYRLILGKSKIVEKNRETCQYFVERTQ